MSISKMPNGRFRARLKSGRVGVASKVFDTRSDAKAWLDRERAALAGASTCAPGVNGSGPSFSGGSRSGGSRWPPRPTAPTGICPA